jgi:hypothetical protein
LLAAGLEETGDTLLVALDAEQDLVALSIADSETILCECSMIRPLVSRSCAVCCSQSTVAG